jgi:U6 snRNA-associated Sm-like protein LSm4
MLDLEAVGRGDPARGSCAAACRSRRLAHAATILQLVELKNGETYNGHMVMCDTWMNIHLREVICTSKVSGTGGARTSCSTFPGPPPQPAATPHAVLHRRRSAADAPLPPPFLPLVQDGDRFWRMPEAYVRGNTIKYLRVPDEVLDKAKEADFRRDGGCQAGATHDWVVHKACGVISMKEGGWAAGRGIAAATNFPHRVDRCCPACREEASGRWPRPRRQRRRQGRRWQRRRQGTGRGRPRRQGRGRRQGWPKLRAFPNFATA